MRYLKVIPFLLAFFLVACGEDFETNMSEKVEPFEYTTQDNEKLNLEDLKGKWWIADFIFTNCTTVCLPMTSNMSQLQEKLKAENIDAEIVSFSVDPEFDTPKVLKEYAKSNNVDTSNWTFLTGYDFQTIKELSIKSFKSPLVEAQEDSNQVAHGTRFYLVNPEGKVVKGYSGTDLKEIDNIVKDLKTVN